MWSTYQKAPKRQRGTEAQFSFSFIVHCPSLLPTVSAGLGTGNAEGGPKIETERGGATGGGVEWLSMM